MVTRRVVVTGGSGCIGSLCWRLLADGHAVLAAGNFVEMDEIYHLASTPAVAEHHRVEARERMTPLVAFYRGRRRCPHLRPAIRIKQQFQVRN